MRAAVPVVRPHGHGFSCSLQGPLDDAPFVLIHGIVEGEGRVSLRSRSHRSQINCMKHKILGLDSIVVTEHHSTLNGIFQFPYIARPGIPA